MFDNSVMGALAKKALASHFEKNNLTAIVIIRDEQAEGGFNIQNYNTPITVLDKEAFDEIVSKVDKQLKPSENGE